MTTIGASLSISGELSSDEDLLIEGRVSGQIVVHNASLTVSAEGRVEAEVRGVRVVVHGALEGGIAATDRIELAPTATVTGNLSANHVVITEGATFTGRIDMDKRTIAARVAQYKATQPG